MGGAIIFLALFPQNYILWQQTKLRAALSLLFLASTVNDVRRKLHMVEIHLTVEKRAKRMPDATVENTFRFVLMHNLNE